MRFVTFVAAMARSTSVQDVLFTLQEFGPVMAVAWWGKKYDDPIFLISNCASPALACAYYRRRFRVETLFSDKKSRGFHIEKSHLSDPSRLGLLTDGDLISLHLAHSSGYDGFS